MPKKQTKIVVRARKPSAFIQWKNRWVPPAERRLDDFEARIAALESLRRR